MPDNTVTLALDGEVALDEFANALFGFSELVAALSEESGAHLDWVIDDLQYSSAVATARGIGESKGIERVVTSYADVGVSLENNAPIRHSRRVQKAVRRIFSRHYRKTRSIRFETAEREAVIPTETVRIAPYTSEQATLTEPAPAVSPIKRVVSTYGAVRGRIQTLTSRGGLRFTLFDLLHDKAVSCYFKEGEQDKIRDLWGSLAIVEGLISRDPISGRPLAIRQVDNMTQVAEPSGKFDYQEARGVAPSLNGLTPEEAIRRVRDAQ